MLLRRITICIGESPKVKHINPYILLKTILIKGIGDTDRFSINLEKGKGECPANSLPTNYSLAFIYFFKISHLKSWSWLLKLLLKRLQMSLISD